MIAKRLFQTTISKSFFAPINKVSFSDNKFKDRQESAEKVFINTQEKKTLSNLLHKLEEQENNFEARESEFESRLRELVNHHKIPNQAAFIAEIINLHRSL